jgi:hypothetical protein
MKNKFVIEGWVARDESGYLCIFSRRPARNLRLNLWYLLGNGHRYTLPKELYPELTWKDEPIRLKFEIIPYREE